MADFKIAYKLTAANEGGYSNVSGDNGGETYCGITRKNFPNWHGWEILRYYTMKHGQVLPELNILVEDFYKENFWDEIKGDNIESQELANQAYDFAVNAGVGAALKMLKES